MALKPRRSAERTIREILNGLGLRLRRHARETMWILRNTEGGFAALAEPHTRSPLPAGAPKPLHRRKEDFASIDELAAGVVHEIRNPLTAMRMWMFSIRETVEHDEDLNRKCCLVAQEITRLERLVQSFLDYARMPQIELRPLRITSVIDETVEIMRPQLESMRVRVRRDDDGEPLLALGDEAQLKQVFINLLTNAAEALDEGGEIRIETGVEVTKKGRWIVLVRIVNEGPEIPDEIRERVLEPFVTTKNRGTGLGLYIAARITEKHGGRLTIEPAAGGTSIAIRIPAVDMEPDGQGPRCR